jgi:hypothetical protein
MENRTALMRRWRLVQSNALSDPRTMNRWFPGQRDLLDLLDVLSREDVEHLADCGTPLFALPLRCTEFSLDACASYSITDSLEVDSVQESFVALSARLDSVRTSLQQACLIFNLASSEANWLQKFCPHELQLLSRDPSMVLTMAVSKDYFIAAATRSMTVVEKTVLSSVSRRSGPPR